MSNYPSHHGVKGMKWNVRKDKAHRQSAISGYTEVAQKIRTTEKTVDTKSSKGVNVKPEVLSTEHTELNKAKSSGTIPTLVRMAQTLLSIVGSCLRCEKVLGVKSTTRNGSSLHIRPLKI